MGRRKPATRLELDSLSERAQDLAIEVGNLSDRVEVAQEDIDGLATLAARFNQLAEAAIVMNRKLLALAELADLRARAKSKAVPYRMHDEA